MGKFVPVDRFMGESTLNDIPPKEPERPSLIFFVKKYEGEVKFIHAELDEVESKIEELRLFIEGEGPLDTGSSCDLRNEREPKCMKDEMDILFDNMSCANARLSKIIDKLGRIYCLIGSIPD